jgi:hypothetical protein
VPSYRPVYTAKKQKIEPLCANLPYKRRNRTKITNFLARSSADQCQLKTIKYNLSFMLQLKLAAASTAAQILSATLPPQS